MIEPPPGATRIGAFEVQLYMVSTESTIGVEKVLHSKLKTGNWPSVAVILEKIHFYLPRVPRVSVQVFKEQRGKVVDQ